MFEVNPTTVKMITNAIKNESNSVMNIVRKNTNGSTELERILLKNNKAGRKEAVNFLKRLLPEECGKVFCTFS